MPILSAEQAVGWTGLQIESVELLFGNDPRAPSLWAVLPLAKPLPNSYLFDPYQKPGGREKALGLEQKDQDSSPSKCHISIIQSFNKHS